MEVIVSKRCSCCTRMLPIERFRLRTKRGQRVHVAQCDQCEKGREAARWQLTKLGLNQRSDKAPSQHQRCNTLLDSWYGQVEAGTFAPNLGMRVAA